MCRNVYGRRQIINGIGEQYEKKIERKKEDRQVIVCGVRGRGLLCW
jgi:hypothetical protein